MEKNSKKTKITAKEIFKSHSLPRPGAIVDLVHFPAQPSGEPEYWTIRLYEDNLKLFSGEDKGVIARWAWIVLAEMHKHGIMAYAEKYERVPD